MSSPGPASAAGTVVSDLRSQPSIDRERHSRSTTGGSEAGGDGLPEHPPRLTATRSETAVAFRTAVAVGDLDGYLHFFSNVDGEPVARVRAGKKAIIGTPLVVADTLLVQSDDGTVSAWVVKEPKQRKGRAPDVAEDEEA